MVAGPRITMVPIAGLLRSLTERRHCSYYEYGAYRSALEAADSAFEDMRGAVLGGRLRSWYKGFPLDKEFWRGAQLDLTRKDLVVIDRQDLSGIMFAAQEVKNEFFTYPKMPQSIKPSIWQQLRNWIALPPTKVAPWSNYEEDAWIYKMRKKAK